MYVLNKSSKYLKQKLTEFKGEISNSAGCSTPLSITASTKPNKNYKDKEDLTLSQL